MGKGKPEPVKTPFQQQQQQTNTYAPMGIASTPEAQAFLGTPLDFGDEVNIDPGVGRRTDLRRQEAENRYNSAFSMGVPRILRESAQAKELRDIDSQGAGEAANAEYIKQQTNNERRRAMTLADLQRKQTVLPNIVQTGGSGTSSGFNTQVSQPQPSIWNSIIGGAAQVGSAAIPFI